MARTLQQTIFLIVMILVLLLAAIILIMTVQSNVTFWMLRPSETAALDIVSYVTALGGTTGNIQTEYKGFTSQIDYYLLNRDKMICVIAQRTPSMPQAGVLTTINCYSTPYVIKQNIGGEYEPQSGTSPVVEFTKYYEEPSVKVETDVF